MSNSYWTRALQLRQFRCTNYGRATSVSGTFTYVCAGCRISQSISKPSTCVHQTIYVSIKSRGIFCEWRTSSLVRVSGRRVCWERLCVRMFQLTCSASILAITTTTRSLWAFLEDSIWKSLILQRFPERASCGLVYFHMETLHQGHMRIKFLDRTPECGYSL